MLKDQSPRICKKAFVTLFKTLFAVSILLLISRPVFSCDCSWSGPFLSVSKKSQLIVRGRVRGYENRTRSGRWQSMQIDVIEVLKGTLEELQIKVWGDNSAMCRPYVKQFPKGSEWIWILDQKRKNNNLPEKTWINKLFDKDDNTSISNCGEYWLKVDGENVLGNINNLKDQGFKQKITLQNLKKMMEVTDHKEKTQTFISSNAVVPNQQDQLVLETVLLHLLEDPKFYVISVSSKGNTIALNSYNPESVNMLEPSQVKNDIGKGNTLSDELQQDLILRNIKSGTKDSIDISFKDIKINKKIILTKLPRNFTLESILVFVKENPDARAWVKAWLPGYSKNGDSAVFRAMVGPSPHGSIVTAYLEKTKGKWTVKWYTLAHFV